MKKNGLKKILLGTSLLMGGLVALGSQVSAQVTDSSTGTVSVERVDINLSTKLAEFKETHQNSYLVALKNTDLKVTDSEGNEYIISKGAPFILIENQSTGNFEIYSSALPDKKLFVTNQALHQALCADVLATEEAPNQPPVRFPETLASQALGHGSYCTVTKLGEHLILRENTSTSEANADQTPLELEKILEKLQPKYIAELRARNATCSDQNGTDHFGQVMTFYQSDCQKKYITGNPNRLSRDFLIQVLRGLQQVHNAGYLDNDVKPENILLDSKDSPAIADFGSATKIGEVPEKVLGSALYQSPELVSYEDLTEKSDVYSLAVTLVSMITGQQDPFLQKAGKNYQKMNKFSMGRFITDGKQADPEFVASVIDPLKDVKVQDRPLIDDDLANLLKQMMSRSLEDRPTIQDCIDRLSKSEHNNSDSLLSAQEIRYLSSSSATESQEVADEHHADDQTNLASESIADQQKATYDQQLEEIIHHLSKKHLSDDELANYAQQIKDLADSARPEKNPLLTVIQKLNRLHHKSQNHDKRVTHRIQQLISKFKFRYHHSNQKLAQAINFETKTIIKRSGDSAGVEAASEFLFSISKEHYHIAKSYLDSFLQEKELPTDTRCSQADIDKLHQLLKVKKSSNHASRSQVHVDHNHVKVEKEK